MEKKPFIVNTGVIGKLIKIFKRKRNQAIEVVTAETITDVIKANTMNLNTEFPDLYLRQDLLEAFANGELIYLSLIHISEPTRPY